jgi:hypothetical protein
MLATAGDDSILLGDALARHYVHHGLAPDGGEHEPWFPVRIGPLTLRLPNPPARRRAVFFHDTHHILTGYNTVFSDGEMVIAGFELGAGCGPFWVAWLINIGMFAFGLVACPRPMFAAFVRGRRATSIYRRQEDRAALSAMTVGQLKSMARIDTQNPVATLGDGLRFAGWAVVAPLILLFPLAAVLVIVSFVL